MMEMESDTEWKNLESLQGYLQPEREMASQEEWLAQEARAAASW
jgi:hypothetical protein